MVLSTYVSHYYSSATTTSSDPSCRQQINIIIYYERKRIQSSEQLGMNRYRHHYEIGSRKQAIVVSASVKRSAYSGGA